jgi:hypothetical protein
MRLIMGTTLENNADRLVGIPQILKFDPKPVCTDCGYPMANIKTNISMKVGLKQNYPVYTPHYCCSRKNCPGVLKRKQKGEKRIFLVPPNRFHAPFTDYDYEVQAEVIRLRWQEKKTHGEIIDYLKTHYSITMDPSAVEPILKIYEIGCAEKYRPEMLNKIKKNGGIILCIDVMKPIGGKKGTLAVYDYLTGLAIGSKRLPNGKIKTYKTYLMGIKQRIDKELNVPVKAILSDALKEQRKAIADVFQGVPHCLCHYHFYELVLKPAKEQDSHVVTILRKCLRDQPDLRDYRQFIEEGCSLPKNLEFLKIFLEPLAELSQWKRDPIDPCFISIQLADRLESIANKLEILARALLNKEEHFDSSLLAMVDRLHRSIWDGLDKIADIDHELKRIQAHLPRLAEIMGDLDESFDQGMNRLVFYQKWLESYMKSPYLGPLETAVLKEINKFLITKAPYLMNYRKVEGVPRTNNFEELEFKAIKYILRRTLGYSGAKEYLYAHGERIVFINPKENLSEIISILTETNQRSARQTIREERQKREGWGRIMREDQKWEEYLKRIDEFINQFQDHTL